MYDAVKENEVFWAFKTTKVKLQLASNSIFTQWNCKCTQKFQKVFILLIKLVVIPTRQPLEIGEIQIKLIGLWPQLLMNCCEVVWVPSGIFCSCLLKEQEGPQNSLDEKGHIFIHLEPAPRPAGEFAGTLERLCWPAKLNSHTPLLYTVKWGRGRGESVL